MNMGSQLHPQSRLLYSEGREIRRRIKEHWATGYGGPGNRIGAREALSKEYTAKFKEGDVLL